MLNLAYALGEAGSSVIDWSAYAGDSANLVATVTGAMGFIMPVVIAMVGLNVAIKLIKKAGK